MIVSATTSDLGSTMSRSAWIRQCSTSAGVPTCSRSTATCSAGPRATTPARTGNPLILYTGAFGQFVYLLPADPPLQAPPLDHFGLQVVDDRRDRRDRGQRPRSYGRTRRPGPHHRRPRPHDARPDARLHAHERVHRLRAAADDRAAAPRTRPAVIGNLPARRKVREVGGASSRRTRRAPPGWRARPSTPETRRPRRLRAAAIASAWCAVIKRFVARNELIGLLASSRAWVIVVGNSSSGFADPEHETEVEALVGRQPLGAQERPRGRCRPRSVGNV